MTETLAEELFDILALRRREAIERGWGGVPDWVFCTLAGSHLDPRNVERVWYRVRRRAQNLGVRPLKLHCVGGSISLTATPCTLTPHRPVFSSSTA